MMISTKFIAIPLILLSSSIEQICAANGADQSYLRGTEKVTDTEHRSLSWWTNFYEHLHPPSHHHKSSGDSNSNSSGSSSSGSGASGSSASSSSGNGDDVDVESTGVDDYVGESNDQDTGGDNENEDASIVSSVSKNSSLMLIVAGAVSAAVIAGVVMSRRETTEPERTHPLAGSIDRRKDTFSKVMRRQFEASTGMAQNKNSFDYVRA